MTGTQVSVRQFLADGIFYEAVGHDDGSSKARAVRRAEASVAQIKPVLGAMIENEVKALVAYIDGMSTLTINSDQIEAISRASDCIIDVAETLGYPNLSRATRDLRRTCRAIDEGNSVAFAIFALHRNALTAGLMG